jgi:hypothetical protein
MGLAVNGASRQLTDYRGNAGRAALSQAHEAEQDCNGVVMVRLCSFCSPAIELLLAVYLLPRYMVPLLVALQHFQPAV